MFIWCKLIHCSVKSHHQSSNSHSLGVPESPRWLIANDRHDEALKIFATYHGQGNPNHPTVQFEYREVRETLKIELEHSRTSSYFDFFKTPGNRYRLMILISLGFFSQWSGNAIISNYANLLYTGVGITDSTTKLGVRILHHFTHSRYCG